MVISYDIRYFIFIILLVVFGTSIAHVIMVPEDEGHTFLKSLTLSYK